MITKLTKEQEAHSMKNDWKKIFRKFYKTQNLGSGAWLVAPNIVEVFIAGLLSSERKRILETVIKKLPEAIAETEVNPWERGNEYERGKFDCKIEAEDVVHRLEEKK